MEGVMPGWAGFLAPPLGADDDPGRERTTLFFTSRLPAADDDAAEMGRWLCLLATGETWEAPTVDAV